VKLTIILWYTGTLLQKIHTSIHCTRWPCKLCKTKKWGGKDRSKTIYYKKLLKTKANIEKWFWSLTNIKVANKHAKIYVGRYSNKIKYSNEMTDDIIYSTQYYMRYIHRAILASVHHRPLKLGRLIVLKETLQRLKKLCSHGNSLLSSPHLLYFNLLVIFSTKKH